MMEGSWRLAASLAAGMGVGFWLRRRSLPGAEYTFTNRSVVITGGSRGLGLVLARKLAREGARVTLLARDPDELLRAENELSGFGGQVMGIPCDITQPQQVDQAIHRVMEIYGRVDVLINDAGIIQVGPLDHMTIQDFEDAMAVHVYGPLYLTRAVLPHMRTAGAGRIVNITSIAGKIAAPHLLPYTASKFAQVGLSDGLRAELRRENILVTTVCPGLMRTGSARNALFKGQHRREYAWFAISDSLPVISMNAQRAARKVIEACRRGKPRIDLGLHVRGAIVLNELFPNASARMLALANRMLPGIDPTLSDAARPGHESESAWAPSVLTQLSEQAALRNNEKEA